MSTDLVPTGNTIHKANSIIKGGNSYSTMAQRLANGIYHHIQKNKKFAKEDIYVPVKELRLLMGLEKSNKYAEVLKKAVLELHNPIVLYNSLATKTTSQEKYRKKSKWQISSFLDFSELLEEKESNELVLKMRVSDSFRLLIGLSNTGDFTKLPLEEAVKFRSKHSAVLYEFIKAYEGFSARGNKLFLDFDRLQIMFNPQNHAKYKYFSKFKPILVSSIEDINKTTDFELALDVNKAEKRYYIYRLNLVEKRKELSHPEAGIFSSELGKLSY